LSERQRQGEPAAVGAASRSRPSRASKVPSQPLLLVRALLPNTLRRGGLTWGCFSARGTPAWASSGKTQTRGGYQTCAGGWKREAIHLPPPEPEPTEALAPRCCSCRVYYDWI